MEFRSSLRCGKRWVPAVIAGALGLGGCATGATRPVRAPMIVIPQEAVCHGGAEAPAGERDPACVADATHAEVTLVYHAARCEPGVSRGVVVTLKQEGKEIQELTRVMPGGTATLLIPRGEQGVTLRAAGEGVEEAWALDLEGAGPVELELGCARESFMREPLQPLVFLGTGLGCRGGAQVEMHAGPSAVRAGGLNLIVQEDEARTLFLPRGQHALKIGGEEVTVRLEAGGAVVALGCLRPVEPTEDGR